MDYPIEVQLKRPVTVEDKTYDKLVFDEPDVGTSIAVEEAKSAGQQTLILLAGMAGVSLDVISKLKETDFKTVGKLVLEPRQKELMAERDAELGNAQTA